MIEFSTYSDEELLRLLRQNNEQAFTEIYERHWNILFISANNILQSKDAAKDIVQEIYVSLWVRRHEVVIETLKPYLLQSVRFQVFRAIRAEKTDREFYKRLTLASQQILTENPLLLKELENILSGIINSLPEDQKEIFRLHRNNGLTYKQIADQKNISVKTVEKKMSQALRQLRFGLDKGFTVFILVNLLN